MTSQEPDKQIKSFFWLFLLLNMFTNFENGIIPAAADVIKNDLKLNDGKLGILGSSVYLGIILGSVFAGISYQNCNNKIVLVSSLYLGIASLSVFLITDNWMFLLISRFFYGFFGVFKTVFLNVWVDSKAQSKRTIWLTMLQIASPLGIFLGYTVTAIFSQENWKNSIWFHIIATLPLTFCISFSKNELIQLIYPKQSIKIRKCSIDSFSTINLMENEKEFSQCQILFKLCSNFIFIFSMLTICTLNFIVTGIQFWISDYFKSKLHESHTRSTIAFLIILIFGPIFGVVFGGIVISKNGGYESIFAIKFCVFCGTMACLAAIYIPFENEFLILCVQLLVFLFFGGALMTPLTGIMLHSVIPEAKHISQSIAQTFYCLLGYFPAPLAFGFIAQQYGMQYGIATLMYTSGLSLIFILITFYYRNKLEKSEKYQKLTSICSLQSNQCEQNI